MKYFSTFSGIGGFEIGLGERGECVGFSEIDKYAIQIYQHHFPNHKAYGDIKTISTDALPDFDLLCGGFPCQTFSIAGKRGGFNDTRGTLFFELARIARAKRPRLLFFENVKGLLSHDGGRTFDTILRTLDELGYDLQWQVLNSKDFGVPQNRERIFIVGNLRGQPRPKIFPFLRKDQPDFGAGRIYTGNEGRLPQSANGQKEIQHTGDTPNQEAGNGSLHEHGSQPLLIEPLSSKTSTPTESGLPKMPQRLEAAEAGLRSEPYAPTKTARDSEKLEAGLPQQFPPEQGKTAPDSQ